MIKRDESFWLGYDYALHRIEEIMNSKKTSLGITFAIFKFIRKERG